MPSSLLTSLSISIAIHLVSSLSSNAIFAITVSGIERNIPTVPRTQPQKTSESKTTSGERPTPFPINLGSIIFPIIMFMVRYQTATISDKGIPPSIRAIITGGMAAIIDPIVGIKLSRNVRTPHKSAKSIPNIKRNIHAKKPVNIDTTVLSSYTL